MLSRVATFALNDQMISGALRVQARTAQLEIEQASGDVSDDFGGLGASSQRVLNLQTSITQSKAYSSAATTVDGQVEVMYSTLGQMATLLTTLRSTATSATSADVSDTTTIESLAETASGSEEELASLLNTSYNGRYVFAGAMVDTAPVDISSSTYPPMTSPSTATTSYYQGDDEIASVRVGSDQVVSYGVTADSSAFEKALRACNLLSNLGSASDVSGTITEALNLLQSAVSGVGTLEAKVSLSAQQLESAVTTQTAFQDQASALETSLTSADVTSVAAELATRQAQLEATYSAISKVQSLSLVDYLR